MLTYFERKARLPFGAQKAVAKQLNCAQSNVAAVLKGAHRNRQIETALAALMKPRTTVVAAFGPPGPERIRRAKRRRTGLAAGKPLTGATLDRVMREVM